MDHSFLSDTDNDPSPLSAQPWWLIRGGRGRVGGSTFLDYVVQWSRHRGRRVKPLDGDLRSRTLSALYPKTNPSGAAIQDAAEAPDSEDLAAMKAWFGGELDQSVGENVCRAVDFGGGDRVMQEYGGDLKIGEFCERFSLGLIWAFILGPDLEDLQHVVQVLRSGHISGGHILLVLNEGVIRHGQTTTGVFATTAADRAYLALLNDGAQAVIMPRLTCMDILRQRGLGFYEAAAGMKDRDGKRAAPTLQHMTAKWVEKMEIEMEASGAAAWLR
jgi:hypothetical protein